jgi:hypothetical protein
MSSQSKEPILSFELPDSDTVDAYLIELPDGTLAVRSEGELVSLDPAMRPAGPEPKP